MPTRAAATRRTGPTSWFGAARSIQARLSLWFSLLLLGVLLVFGVVLYAALAQQLRQANSALLGAQSAQVQAALNVQNGQLSLQDLPEGNGGAVDAGGAPWRLWNATGQLLAAGPGQTLPVTQAVLQPARNGRTVDTVLRSASGEDFLVRVLPLEDNGRGVGVLAVGLPLAGTERALRLLLVLLLFAIPASVLVAGFGGLWLARRALAPIDRLTRAAQSIQAGDLARRLEAPPVDDEVGRLAATLNDMLERLDAAFGRQRQFTADASHELRTPLAIIRATAEEGKATHSRAEAQAALGSIDEETQRLQHLVEALLTLARADTGIIALEREVVQLDELLGDVVAQLTPLAQRQDVTLHWKPEQQVTIMGDAARLVQLALNLLENAIKYSHPGGTVHVVLRQEGADAVIQVRDNGIGIAPDQTPRLFERFYRADAARGRGGAGLGLSIARWISEAHSGTIQVESTLGQGSTFTVRLASRTMSPVAGRPTAL